MAAPERPLPLPDDATAPYWEAARRRELVVQTCADCEAPRFPPRPMCPHCRSLQCAWRPLSGRGTVYSFVVVHPPVLPAFAERVPLLIALVELAEDPGLRVVGNLLDVAPAELEIGLPVEVTFEDAAPDVTLPQWRPAGQNAARAR